MSDDELPMQMNMPTSQHGSRFWRVLACMIATIPLIVGLYYGNLIVGYFVAERRCGGDGVWPAPQPGSPRSYYCDVLNAIGGALGESLAYIVVLTPTLLLTRAAFLALYRYSLNPFRRAVPTAGLMVVVFTLPALLPG